LCQSQHSDQHCLAGLHECICGTWSVGRERRMADDASLSSSRSFARYHACSVGLAHNDKIIAACGKRRFGGFQKSEILNSVGRRIPITLGSNSINVGHDRFCAYAASKTHVLIFRSASLKQKRARDHRDMAPHDIPPPEPEKYATGSTRVANYGVVMAHKHFIGSRRRCRCGGGGTRRLGGQRAGLPYRARYLSKALILLARPTWSDGHGASVLLDGPIFLTAAPARRGACAVRRSALTARRLDTPEERRACGSAMRGLHGGVLLSATDLIGEQRIGILCGVVPARE
jgi:hypothetical protein